MITMYIVQTGIKRKKKSGDIATRFYNSLIFVLCKFQSCNLRVLIPIILDTYSGFFFSKFSLILGFEVLP